MSFEDYKISYICKLSDNNKRYEVEYNKLKKSWIRDNGFYEIKEDKQEFIRPYFDFDSIETEDEYNEVMLWLNMCKKQWGDYVVGGYTNITELAGKTGLRYIKDAHHKVSIHVIFYEAVIKCEVLNKMMGHVKEGWLYRGINRFCDYHVYNKGRRLMRHVLSDKIENSNKKVETSGFFTKECGKVELWKTFMTPMGNEKEVEMLSFVALKKANVSSIKNNDDVDGITYDDKLIKLNKDGLVDLLDNFDNCFDTLLNTCASLFHSPYELDFLEDVVDTWYRKVEHSRPDQAIRILRKYYEYEESNRWFFTLINKLPEDIRKKYLKATNKYVDESKNINESSLTWMNVSRKQYDNVVDLLNDLKSIIGFYDTNYYLRVKKNGQPYIKIYSDEKLRKLFIGYPLKGNKDNNLYQIFRKNINLFLYDDVQFYPSNTDGNRIIKMFCGFKYEAKKGNYDILQPFLKHIREVICDCDDDKYNYLMCWFANIIKNVAVKNGTMPVIYGGQGSGKTSTVQVFAELIGNYANRNVDDLDKVFGRFNGLIKDSLLIVINETGEANEKFAYTNKIKSKLTEETTIQELKGIDSVEIKSFANYIMTTNNSYPLRDEKGNRRYVYFRTNDKHKGDNDYYNKLMAPIQNKNTKEYNKAFMETLYYYMINEVDVSKWDAERYVNEKNNDIDADYNENLERQYYDLDLVDKFVVDNITKFIDGYPSNMITNDTINGYKANGIFKKIREYCDEVRKQEGNYKIRIYTFNKDKANELWNIAYYKNREEIEEYYKSKEVNELNNNEELVNDVMDILKDFNIEDYRKQSRRSCLDIRKVKELCENSDAFELLMAKLLSENVITKKNNDYKITEIL